MFSHCVLCLSAVALAFAFVVADKVGFVGTFPGGGEGGLQGTVAVQDAHTVVIEHYTLEDAGAPSLYWWGSATDDLSSGFRISEKQVTEIAEDITLRIPLDAGKRVADFSTIGLWCERFGVNFGQTSLGPSSGNDPSTTSGNSNTAPTTINGAPKPTGSAGAKSLALQPILSDRYTTTRVYFASVIGLVLLDSTMHLPIYLLAMFNRGQYPTRISSALLSLGSALH